MTLIPYADMVDEADYDDDDDYDFEDDFESDDEQDLYVRLLLSIQFHRLYQTTLTLTTDVHSYYGGWRWRCWWWSITCWHMVGQGSIGFG
jgi:hypothetical protein